MTIGQVADLEEQLQNNLEEDPRSGVARCISHLRASILDSAAGATKAPEKCAATLKLLESVALDDATRLVTRRDAAAERFRNGDVGAAADVATANKALKALAPVVDSSGKAVELTKSPIKTALDKAAAKADIEKTCSDSASMRMEGSDVSKITACLGQARSPHCADDLLKKERSKEEEASKENHYKRRHHKLNEYGAAEDVRSSRSEHELSDAGTVDAAKRRAQRQCNEDAATYEATLRDIASMKTQALASLKAKHDDLDTPEKKASNDAAQQKLNDDIDTIRKYIPIPGEADYPGFLDYGEWFGRFQTGLEFVTLNEAFVKGFPRVSTMIGLHLPGPRVPITAPSQFFGRFGGWLTFAAMLTSTAENTKQPVGSGSGSTSSKVHSLDDTEPIDPAASKDPKKAIEFELNGFFPFWRSGFSASDRTLTNFAGLLLSAGALKRDNDNFAAKRFYGGLRIARSPGQFGDLLVGHSGELRSLRLELRGQMPFPVVKKTNVSIGADGNFGVNRRRNRCSFDAAGNCTRVPEPDSIRIFITYDLSKIDFASFVK